eukprot:m.397198 g.397198  ORF g.397198 m.397198 type:complete len:383 (-) comp21126_c0_seq1:1418-2566(-)
MDDEQERIVSECMPTESITAAGAVSTRFASRAPTQIQQHRGAADALWTSGGRRCNMGCCHTCVPGGTDVTWHRLHGYSSSDEDSSSLSLSSLSSELSSVAGEGVYDCSGQRSSQLVRSYSAALCVNSTSLGMDDQLTRRLTVPALHATRVPRLFLSSRPRADKHRFSGFLLRVSPTSTTSLVLLPECAAPVAALEGGGVGVGAALDVVAPGDVGSWGAVDVDTRAAVRLAASLGAAKPLVSGNACPRAPVCVVSPPVAGRGRTGVDTWGTVPATGLPVVAMDTSGRTNGDEVGGTASASLPLPPGCPRVALPGMVASVALTRSVNAVALSAISCVRCTIRLARDSVDAPLSSPARGRDRVSWWSKLALRGRLPLGSPGALGV